MNFDYPQADQHFIKLESDSYGNNLFINNILKNNIKKTNNNNNEYTISEFDNIQLQNSVAGVLSPESDNGSVYDHPNTKQYNISSGISYNSIDRHTSALSVSSKNETIYSNASSPSVVDMQHPISGVTSPEGSVCSSNCPTPKLMLDVSLRPAGNFDLTTPSIIEDVVELEKTNPFNILEYMQSEVSSNSCLQYLYRMFSTFWVIVKISHNIQGNLGLTNTILRATRTHKNAESQKKTFENCRLNSRTPLKTDSL